MRTMLIIAVMVAGLVVPVQAQNVVDGFGVKHWVGGAPHAYPGGIYSGYGNFQSFQNQSQTYRDTRFDIGPTLARNLPWAALLGYLGHQAFSLEKKKLDVEGGYAVAKLNGRDVLVHRTGLNVYGVSEISTQGRATHAVVPDGFYGPPVERWNGRDWGDPEIEEMKREARRLEDKADAIERHTDAQVRLEEARRYRDARRPVAAAKQVSDGKIEELERKLDLLLQRFPNGASPKPKEEPVIEEIIPQSKRIPIPEAGPEKSFNWQPASPVSPKVVLAGGLTPEEQEFFGKGKGLVITETFSPNSPKGKILQRDKEGNWRQVN